MSSEWIQSLSSLVTIKGGKRLPAGESLQAEPNSHPYIRVRDVGQRELPRSGLEYVPDKLFPPISRYIVEPNDVVLSIVGTIGALSIVDIKYNLASLTENCVKLYGLDKEDSLYLYYFLSSPIGQQEIHRGTVGAVQPKLPIYNIEKIKVIWPPEKMVRRNIALLLGALDDHISLLRETNTTLEAIALALFKSWFVDFDPVHAKQQGREPEGMDAATAALFPDSFEESELGLVPTGWRVTTLADAFEINPMRKLKKGLIAPYLDMASLATSGHSVEAPIQREMGSGAKFRNGDTLLARITPCLENGKSAFVDFLADDQIGWGSTEFLILRPKAPLPEYFGYLLCRHTTFRDYAIQSMSGTSGRQRIQNDVLGRYVFALPNNEVASIFGEIVNSIQKKIAKNHEVSQTLTTLRDTLLPRLISGQLRLPEAEVLIEEAVA